MPGSQVVILRARWRPRGWGGGGGHQERQEVGGESSALDASPGEADLRDATSSPLPPTVPWLCQGCGSCGQAQGTWKRGSLRAGA